MSMELPEEKKSSPGRMFIPSLAVASLADGLSSVIVGLLIAEIALTFLGSSDRASVAVVGQIGTVVNAVQVIFALFMSYLVVRFRHRSLLLVGLLLISVSALGSALAPNLVTLGLFSVMDGIGSIMLGIMSFTIIGELLVFKKKAQVISYLASASYFAGILGVLTVGFVASTSAMGWRSAFSLLVLPLAVVSLILCFFTVPSGKQQRNPTEGSIRLFLKASKQVLQNKSAASCLMGSLLMNAAAFAGFLFVFYAVEFKTSVIFRSFIMATAAVVWVIAAVLAGRIASKGGVKTLATIGALGNGVFLAAFFFMPNVWVALVVHMVGLIFGATGGIAFSFYSLEQIPQARGTMMSLRRVFQNIGQTLGPALGGAMLFFFSYQAVGLAFGVMCIVAGVVIYFFTKEPLGRNQ